MNQHGAVVPSSRLAARADKGSTSVATLRKLGKASDADGSAGSRKGCAVVGEGAADPDDLLESGH